LHRRKFAGRVGPKGHRGGEETHRIDGEKGLAWDFVASRRGASSLQDRFEGVRIGGGKGREFIFSEGTLSRHLESGKKGGRRQRRGAAEERNVK